MTAAQLADLASEAHDGLNADVAARIAQAVINAGSFRGSLLDRRSLRRRRRELERTAVAAAKEATDFASAPAWVKALSLLTFALPAPWGLAIRAALFIVEQLLQD